MQAINQITGLVVPLPLTDVDTDMIIPARYLTRTDQTGYGDFAFAELKKTHPDLAICQPKPKQANILCANRNFGCGSSREHAVWALQGAGYQAILSPSYSDIFFSNAAKNGLLLIIMPQEQIDHWLTLADQTSLSLDINLKKQIITHGSEQYPFDFDPFRKDCLLQGLDDLDYLLKHMPAIDAFDAENQQ